MPLSPDISLDRSRKIILARVLRGRVEVRPGINCTSGCAAALVRGGYCEAPQYDCTDGRYTPLRLTKEGRRVAQVYLDGNFDVEPQDVPGVTMQKSAVAVLYDVEHRARLWRDIAQRLGHDPGTATTSSRADDDATQAIVMAKLDDLLGKGGCDG